MNSPSSETVMVEPAGDVNTKPSSSTSLPPTDATVTGSSSTSVAAAASRRLISTEVSSSVVFAISDTTGASFTPLIVTASEPVSKPPLPSVSS